MIDLFQGAEITTLKRRADAERRLASLATAGEIGSEAADVLERAILAGRHSDNVRSALRRLLRSASVALYQLAIDYSREAEPARMLTVRPVYGGGLQVAAEHPLGDRDGIVVALLQVNRRDLADEASLAALSEIHDALIADGRPKVAARIPPIGAAVRDARAAAA